MQQHLPQDRPVIHRWFISVALVLAFVALVAPGLGVRVVPTQDGPIHLAQADIIARSGWYGPLEGTVGNVYVWNRRLDPNLLVYVVLALLIRVTGDPFIGHQVFVGLYACLFFFVALLAARSEAQRSATEDRPDGPWLVPFLALLVLPFSLFFHWGFFNYMLGIPAFLLFAVWWRRPGIKNIWRLLVAAALGLAAALAHITAFLAVALLLAAHIVNSAAWPVRSTGLRQLRAIAMEAAMAVFAALPGLVIVLMFVLGSETGGTRFTFAPWPALRMLAFGNFLPSFDKLDVVVLLPGALAIGLVVVHLLRRREPNRQRPKDWTWAVFLVSILAVTSMNPVSGQGVALGERLALYGFVAAVFAITPYLPGKRLEILLASLIVLVVVGQSLSRFRVYRFWAPVYEAAMAAGTQRPGTSFAGSGLIERSDDTYSRRVRVGFQVEQIAAIAAGGAAVTSALPSVKYGYFPLRYQFENDFFRTMPRWSWSLKYPEEPFKAYRAKHDGMPQVLIATGSKERAMALAARLGLPSCYFEHSGAVGLLACEESTSGSLDRNRPTP